MTSEARSARIASLLVALVSHIAAGCEYWIARARLPFHERWTPHFYFLLGVSFLLAFLVVSCSRARLVFLILQFLALLVLGYPLGRDLTVEFTLLIPLVVEANLFWPIPSSSLLSIPMILITIVQQRGGSAWGLRMPAPPAEAIIAFGAFALALYGLAFLLRVFIDRYRRERDHGERMESAVVQLMNANVAFQRYAKEAEEESAASERRRVSREIHDSVGHTFVSLMMMLEDAVDRARAQDPDLPAVLRMAREQARYGLNETRRAVRSLRSKDPERPVGLRAVHKMVKAFQGATGVEIRTEYCNMPLTLGPDLDALIYRIVQEGLTNAFRHGRASMISVGFWLDEEMVTVRVEDNGAGSDEITEGVGLSGMRERVSPYGGTVAARNLPHGFGLMVRIPVQRLGAESYEEDTGPFGGRSGSLRGEPEERLENTSA